MVNRKRNKMKVITVNLPLQYLEFIENQLAVYAEYPSRSEWIRCAIREFIQKEVNLMKAMQKTYQADATTFDQRTHVQCGDAMYILDRRDKINEPG